MLEELTQLENKQLKEEIEQYLPWSKDLPEGILNYEEPYEELKVE